MAEPGKSPIRPRVLALDPGGRRTGLAISDPFGRYAIPIGRIEARGPDELIARLRAEVAEREPRVIVVGVPRHDDGTAGARAQVSLQLIQRLQAAFPDRQIVGVDEAHTTDEAHERLRGSGLKAAARKKLADAVAAVLILERYLASY